MGAVSFAAERKPTANVPSIAVRPLPFVTGARDRAAAGVVQIVVTEPG